MQNPAKVIKVVSIIILIFSILSILASGAILLGGGFLANNAGEITNNGQMELDEEMQANLDQLSDVADVDLSNATSEDVAAGVGALAILLGVFALVSSIYKLVYSIIGLNAAKGKFIKAACFLGTFDLILSAIRLVSNITSGGGLSGIISGAIGLILPILYVMAAYALKKEAQQ